MKNYKLLLITFCVIFAAGTIFSLSGRNAKQEFEESGYVLHGPKILSEKSGDPPHYKIYTINPKTGKKELTTLAFVTTDIVPEETGYSGPIKMMVEIDLTGAITNISVLSHNETPSYVSDDELTKLIAQFIARDANSSFEIGDEIDAISGATTTSKKVARTLEKSLKIISESVLNVAAKETIEKERISITQIVIPLILFVIATLGILLRNTLLRWISLTGGLLYFGFATATMFSVMQIANIGLLKFPDFSASPLWYLLIGGVLFTLFIFGNVYCCSLCPFAALQEILNRIAKKLKVKQLEPSENIERRARYGKYIVLFVALIISFVAGNSDLVVFEPYVLLFTGNATTLGWIFVSLLLILSLFNFRFWCKYLCPVGAFNGLMSRFSLFKIRVGIEDDSCNICTSVCPTNAIKFDKANKLTLDWPECILCTECLRKCPKGTLKYKGPNK